MKFMFMSKKQLWAAAIILPVFIWASYSLFFKEQSIHVAIVGPMSGDNAVAWKLTVQAAQLYFDTLNKKGGVNGKPIILDVFDDQNDPVNANARAVEIVEQDRAVAVIGHDYSSCSISGGKVYAKHRIPAVSTSSTNVKVTENNDWYFRTIFNDSLQGRFLAHYAKKVLGHQKVSVIYKGRTKGNYLAQVFEETSQKLGVEVKYKWAFDEENNYEQLLARIVADLRVKPDAGLIFLAVHAAEGIKLVKLIKDAGIQNPIIVQEDLASKTFQQGFNDFPKEKLKPGYYTNGIYVTTPLIFDTANEKAQHFKEVYKAAYQEQPDEAAAFAYDAALMIVEAMKNTGVRGQPETIEDDRQKIRDYLANLTNINDAVEGASGLNYFDKAGNAQKPISIGIYKHRKIVSAATQLQMVRDINEISNLESVLNKEQVLLIDDKYLYKTNVVYVGMKINEISELDIKNLTYQLDFYLWFRFNGEFNTKNIEFLNAAEEPMMLGEPIVEKEGHKTRHLYRIKGRFKADFLPNHIYYKQHILGVSFRHRDLTRDNLIYVTDVLGMGLINGELWLDKVQKSKLLSPVYEWAITQAAFFQDITRKSSLGSLKYLNVQSGAIEYSRFNAVIQIDQHEFSLRRMFAPQLAHYILIVSGILLLLLVFFDKKFKCFHKAIWVVQTLLVFLVQQTLSSYNIRVVRK